MFTRRRSRAQVRPLRVAVRSVLGQHCQPHRSCEEAGRIAREMVGFIWDIARIVTPADSTATPRSTIKARSARTRPTPRPLTRCAALQEIARHRRGAFFHGAGADGEPQRTGRSGGAAPCGRPHGARKAAPDMIHSHLPGSTRRLTLGADKGYDRIDLVRNLRQARVTPHVAWKARRSAINSRTTRRGGFRRPEGTGSGSKKPSAGQRLSAAGPCPSIAPSSANERLPAF